MSPSEHDHEQHGAEAVEQHLGLWDAVSIIVGIVVGTTIFKMPPDIFGGVSNAWQGLGCWALGGVLVLVGAFCYAELATTYPRMGGDYVYLTRAYGRGLGFLFGWGQLAVILTGSTGAMAFAFADYGAELLGWEKQEQAAVWLAVGSVVVLTALNIAGVVFGKAVQNALSLVKILGLTAIVVAGFGWGGGKSMEPIEPLPYLGFGLSMVFVLYAYGGWNDAAFVAAEVRNRSRNMPLALVLGTAGIMVVYLLVNAAYLWALGFGGIRESKAPAADVLALPLGEWGANGMRLLVMLSALGAINGLIFTGSRVYVSLGRDHRVFHWLGLWRGRRGAPVGALLAHAAFSLLLILAVGTKFGRQGMADGLTWLGFQTLPGEESLGGFGTLVAGTSPVFWAFFLLTGLAVFILRIKDRGIERPFSAPLFPLEPIVFCGTSIYMLYSSVAYARGLSFLGVVPLLIGLPFYWLSAADRRESPRSQSQ